MADFKTPLLDSIYPVQIARHLEFLPKEMWFVFSHNGMEYRINWFYHILHVASALKGTYLMSGSLRKDPRSKGPTRWRWSLSCCLTPRECTKTTPCIQRLARLSGGDVENLTVPRKWRWSPQKIIRWVKNEVRIKLSHRCRKMSANPQKAYFKLLNC